MLRAANTVTRVRIPRRRAATVRTTTVRTQPSGRRDFSGLRSSGSARPTATRPAHVSPSAGPRVFKREVWTQDCGLGANNRAVRDQFILTESPSDSALPELRHDDAALEKLANAIASVSGKRPAKHVLPQVGLWQALNLAPRELLDSGPYVAYSRCAMDEASKRGGKINFFLSGLSAAQHFGDAILVEHDHKKAYADYVASVSYTEQQGTNLTMQLETMTPEDFDALVDSPPRAKQALITSLELADVMETKPRDDVAWVAANGKQLDPAEFKRLYTAAMEATRTQDARDQYLDAHGMGTGGTFPPDAQAAVDAFQAFIEGKSAPASTATAKPASKAELKVATSADRAQVAGFFENLDPATWEQRFRSRKPENAGAMAQKQAMEPSVLAHDGDRLVGVATVGNSPGASVCEVSLAIQPDAQGRGIGRALLLDAEKLARARGMRSIEASTSGSDTRMAHLLSQSGYEPGAPGPEVLWTKRLVDL